MLTEENDYLQRSVVANAQWIDKILWAGTVVCAVIIALRLLGDDAFSYQGAKIPLRHAWIVIVVLTGCHFYTTVMFRISARKLWIEKDEQTCNKVWNRITTEGGMFMRGMKLRLFPDSGGGFALMGNEPATWFSHICAIGLFFAIVPYELSFSWRTLLAFVLVIINWSIGSHWAIALSELAVSKERSILLAGRTRNRSSRLEDTRKLYQNTTRELVEAVAVNLEARRTALPLKELTGISRRLQESVLSEEDFQTLLKGSVQRLSENHGS